MPDYKDIFRTKESQLFCKAWTAVHITRDGLVDFVDKEFHTFHNSILPACFNCLVCTAEHVLESKTLLPCQDHRTIRDAIHQEHRFSKPKPKFSGPSWKNMKPENWTTSSWDIAKCFMPIGGYLDKATAAETDLNGIIGAVINCKHFQTVFTADLSKDNNICIEVRKKVNEIRHFKNMEPGITDADLNANIDLFTDLLNDTKSLQGDLKATDARNKLNKLKFDTLVITTEEAGEILKDALNEFGKLQNDFHTTMDSAKVNALQAMKDKLDDACKHLNEIGNDQVNIIEDAGSQAVKLVGNEKSKACKELFDHRSEMLGEIRKKEDDYKTVLIKVGTDQLNRIEEGTLSALNEVTTHKTAAVVEIEKANEAAKKQCMEAGAENVQLIEETATSVKREIESLADNREAEFHGKKEDAERDLEVVSSKIKSDLNQEAGAVCLELQRQRNKTINDAEPDLGVASSKIKSDVNQEAALKKETENVVSDARDEMTEEAREIIRDVRDKAIKTQEKNTIDEKNYEERKTALREALAQHYLKRHSTMPLSLLTPEVDEQLNMFYVPFNMEKVDTKSTTKSEKTTQILDMYKSIFYDGDTSHMNIYIQGEAGIGKTTFCTKLALVWSENVSKEICRKDCSSNKSTVQLKQNKGHIFSDETTIDKFDYVFSLALRDVADECEVEKMIETQIVSELPDHSKYTGLVPTILTNERCLIILDGLDEWSHQRKDCKKSRKFTPHTKSWSKTTVLTLTRPWKMNEVRLKDSEVCVLIQITGITDTKTFTRNVLNRLNDKYNTTLDVRDFLEYIEDEKLEHFLDIPVIAMQLLWLWHSGHELGDSKCQIYINMLDMLFGRVEEKAPSANDDTTDDPKAGLPPCFESTEFCEQHRVLLDWLGSLALHTLHSSKREESLVFSESIVKSHVKSTAAQKTALTTGIVSQHKSPSRNKRTSHFSFLHKTFQEFLAACYIATHADESENIVKTLFQVYGKTVDIMDISELFIFVCGLNTEMSSKISDSVMKLFSDKLTNHIEELHVSGGRNNVADITKSLQKMILAGYKESINNGHQDPHLSLHHVYYNMVFSYDKKYRDRLVDMNIDKIVTLSAGGIWRYTVDAVKIQQILAQSSSTISHVSLVSVDGLTDACLDLFTNITLKYLNLWDINGHFDIKLNTSSLLYCYLGSIEGKVAHNVLSALTAAPKLHTLGVGYCLSMPVLCQVLPTLPMLHRLHVEDYTIPVSLCQVMSTLSQLQRLTVDCSRFGSCEDPHMLCQAPSTLSNLQSIKLVWTDLGDNDFLLPNSIMEIVLRHVKLTCRSVRQLVDRLTQIPHQVTCELWNCIVRPAKERDDIEWDSDEEESELDAIVWNIQQSHMFEIHSNYIYSDGRISLHFTKLQT